MAINIHHLPFTIYHYSCVVRCTKSISHYVGTCVFRSADRNQSAAKGCGPFPQKLVGRRILDVPILYLSAQLSQPRERRSACEARKKHVARIWACGNAYHHRQTVWDDGTLFQQKSNRETPNGATARTVLV